jgi:hypothetical protein
MSDAHPEIVQLPPEPHAAAIAESGRHGAHVGISEAESPWIPYGDVASIHCRDQELPLNPALFL